MKKTIIAAAALLALAACNQKETGNSATAAERPAAAQAQTAAPAGSNILTGEVLETFASGGYSYMRLATPSGEEWAAVRETKVEKGQKVSVNAEMTMEKFESKTLGRTFERIIFGSMAGEGAAPVAAMPASSGAAGDSAAAHMQSPSAGPIQVERAPGGQTVAELWAGKGSLNGKPVVVRGKVVKFLGGIMGTNWMHIQDGSGSAAKGDHDLTVTTNDTAAVGDVVTVSGTAATGKDFGAGYSYELIVENAKLQK